MASSSLRERYVGMLLDQLSETRYPSTMMMERIESAITDRGAAEDYVTRLLETMEQDLYPSPQMIERVNRLISTIESAS